MRALLLMIVVFSIHSSTSDVLFDSSTNPEGLQRGDHSSSTAQDSDDFSDAPWDEETTGEDDAEKGPRSGNANEEVSDVPWDVESEDQNDQGETDSDNGSTDAAASGRPPQPVILDKMEKADWEGVIKLAEGGADVNAMNEWKETLLHHCSEPHNPQLKALKVLIKKGAKLNVQDVDGCTPLIWAVHNNHFENAKVLIDAGADMTLIDVKGRVAKDHAMSQKMRSLFAKPGEEVTSGVPDLGVADFDKEVMKSETDVVLYMYSPACGYCREFAPSFDELAAGLRPTSLKFMKMDVTKGNPPGKYAVDSLPTIFLSKKTQGGAKPDPLTFAGKRTVPEITKWLQKSATNRFMFTSGGKEQEVPENFGDSSGDTSTTESDALKSDPPQHEEL
jgi:ankyrin repeat protein